MQIPRWTHFPGPRTRYGRPLPGTSEAVRARPNLQNGKPAWDFSRRAYIDRASLPPVHPRAAAWARTRFYIGGNHEYSMTAVRKQRVRTGRLAPAGALG